MAKYFFCGIGGIGMNPLAFLLKDKGHEINGSDRGYVSDSGIFKELIDKGIKLFPQDGSGIDASVDYFIVSTAVEETIPDYEKAKKLGIKIIKRPELLAEIINNAEQSIAVGGTSGKTTITGMLAHIFKECKKDPLVINGGIMLNYDSSLIIGNGTAIAEADESNGTIELYKPDYAVISNISLDHKSLDELYDLFSDFAKKTKKRVVVNADCEMTNKLSLDDDKIYTFGISNKKADFNAYDIHLECTKSSFSLNNVRFTLNMAGIHNVQNALAAISLGKLMGLDFKEMAKAISSFKGIKRRMEYIGKIKGIDIIDDFAHNPDKISSAIKAVKPYVKGKLITIFQPHGFNPTKLMRQGYVDAFLANLGKQDVVIMPEIYYAGGHVVKDISSKDLTEEIKEGGVKSEFFEKREEILPFIKEISSLNDKILVMGARDMTLNDFAKQIFESLK